MTIQLYKGAAGVRINSDHPDGIHLDFGQASHHRAVLWMGRMEFHSDPVSVNKELTAEEVEALRDACISWLAGVAPTSKNKAINILMETEL